METEILHDALRRALLKVDNNQSKFAAAIGTSQQLVSYWMRKQRPLPAEHVLSAEAAGFGSRHELRPDLYPVPTFIGLDLASQPDMHVESRVVICDACDERIDRPGVRACPNVDCPHTAREAA